MLHRCDGRATSLDLLLSLTLVVAVVSLTHSFVLVSLLCVGYELFCACWNQPLVVVRVFVMHVSCAARNIKRRILILYSLM